ncbi:MAG TPA: NUDIX hydrolase [Candidatus Saccharimonadales bacterium]|nr:NUDIX hydrolase [Candidatus Saccharimonadales bacterium]
MGKPQKWEELKREVVYQKYSQIIERRDYRLPNGEIADYYIHVEPPGACALAITKDNMVVTIPQYRPGPDAILQELPGGRVEKGEDPKEAAMRELLEETGYAGDVVEDWAGTWQADAYTQLNRTIVIVKNCTKVTDSRLETTEFGEAVLVDITDFVALARTGQLTDAAGAMLALDHLNFLKR